MFNTWQSVGVYDCLNVCKWCINENIRIYIYVCVYTPINSLKNLDNKYFYNIVMNIKNSELISKWLVKSVIAETSTEYSAQ